MKTYRGRRGTEGCFVTVDGRPLAGVPSPDSTVGFEWGYDGAGPRRLALAILHDHFGDEGRARDGCGRFLDGVVVNLTADEWTLTSDQIDGFFASSVNVPLTLRQLIDRLKGLG